jgi:DNA-binding CsgD family transcriptional regulator
MDLAERLGLSVKSVNTYIEHLFGLANVNSRNRLHLAALEAGRCPGLSPG